MNILHVESNAEYREKLLHQLIRQGHSVIQAASGMQALDVLLGSTLPDVVICGGELSDISGITFLENLRGTVSLPCSNLPFILTYDHQMYGPEWISAMKHNVFNFIPMHGASALIIHAINEIMEKRHAEPASSTTIRVIN